MKPAKRLLAAILAAAMMVCMLPASAFAVEAAEETTVSVTGTQVTSVEELTSGGEFVILAEYDGTYYALNNEMDGKISASDYAVTVSDDGTISGSSVPTWTLAACGDGVSLYNGSEYLSYTGSSKDSDLDSSDIAYEWTVTVNDNGTISLTETTTSSRVIGFNQEKTQFGAYKSSSYVLELVIFKTADASDTTDDADSTDFVVLSTTDVHGKAWDTNLLNDTSVTNSLLRVSTAVSEIREEYGEENVLLLDNGDLYQGTPISAYQISQLTTYLSTGSTDGLDENLIDEDGNFLTVNPMSICLEYIGYDTLTLGNHEFNYAWDTMQSIYTDLEENGVSVLAANLYYTDGSNAFSTYVTREISVGGETFTIGILGMENTDCTRWDVADNYPGIEFSLDSAAEAQKYVDEMKELGCDFIILAYHSGLGSSDDSELVLGSNTENQVLRVIENTTGIDMVVAGHDHSTGYSNNTYENADGEDVLVVNAGGSTLTETVFTAIVDENGELSVTLKSSENLDLSQYEDDETLKAIIEPYAAAAENYINQSCGTLLGDWDTVAQSNCYLEQSDTMDLINRSQITMGTQYIAEKYDTEEEIAALYEETGLDHLTIDISASSVVFSGNYPASAGELTMKNIYEFYKYDNTLYVISLTGAEIRSILEEVASTRLSATVKNGTVTYSTIGDNFTNPIFYGLDFYYDMAQDEGSRVVITGFADGREFDDDEVYLLAINNYHLGNGCFSDYSTEDAIWSQTDDLGGGVIQDLIAEFVAQETEENGGVYAEPSNWYITYTGDLEEADTANTAVIAARTTEVEDGDTIVIYSVGGSAPVSAETNYTGLALGTATIADNILYGEDNAAQFTVGLTEDGYYTLSVDGQYLTSGTSGNSLSLTDEITDCSKWEFEVTDDGQFRLHNVGASYNGNNNQYLEYYSGRITTYGLSSSEVYLFEIYTVQPAATELTENPQTGDQIVIYYNAGGTTVGTSLTGVDAVQAGSLLLVYEGTAVLDVTLDEETGYYYFQCDGKYLTSGATGNSLSFTDEATEYSLWEIVEADAGTMLRAVNAYYGGYSPQYLEYYSGRFTTYGLSSSSTSAYLYTLYAFNGYAEEAEDPDSGDSGDTGEEDEDTSAFFPDSVAINIGATEESIIVTWYDDEEDAGTLTINGTAYTASVEAASKDGCYINTVTIEDLEPSTEYTIVLTSSDGDTSEEYSYTTTAFGDGETFSFVAVGDPQIGASGNTESDTEGWTETVSTILSDGTDYSFIFSLGDQINAYYSGTDSDYYEDEYTGFLSAFDSSNVLPLAVLVGNHDAGNNDSSLYTEHFETPNTTEYGENQDGDGDYYFTYNGVLFMVLNSSNLSVAEHQAFMEETIAANPDAAWTIVAFHKSIYSVASHVTESDIETLRTGLSPIFYALDIDVVIQGHDHVYARSYIMTGETGMEAVVTDEVESYIINPDGVQYVTLNSASGSKYYNITSEAFTYTAVMNQEKTTNYTAVTISDDEITLVTYRTTDGSIVDEFTIHKCADLDDLTYVEAKDATADEKGNIAYYYCETCGTYYDADGNEIDAADVIIPATGDADDDGDSDGNGDTDNNGDADNGGNTDDNGDADDNGGSNNGDTDNDGGNGNNGGIDAPVTPVVPNHGVTKPSGSGNTGTGNANGDADTGDTDDTNGDADNDTATAAFTDDDGTGTWTWASDAIYALAEAGIVEGYEDGSYLPDNSLTRAEAAAIIARAYGLTITEGEASVFDDVADSHWAVAYINACAAAGIVSGRDTGDFDADATITRAEMAVMIVRAEGLTIDSSAEASFTDTVGHWASAYIEACASAGLVEGIGGGLFDPDADITRAQMAALIARAFGLVETV